MTRLSEYLLPTEKQPPADAEAVSHKLMVRAGLVRQMGAGMWSWLPAGWRVHQRVVAIIREEMDAIGGQEMLMPVLQPAEPWRKTGRLEIEELFKLTDRKGSELVLAMTHEEAVTFHVAQIVRSYRDLPLILYHFQVKERDEPRPARGGAAHAGVHHEGLLLLRPRPGRPGGALRAARRRLRPHHGAHRAALLPRRGRRGDDGRPGRARVHGAVRGRRGRDRARARLRREPGGRPARARRCEKRATATTGTGRRLTIEPAIEVGNIFKLGTRYSEPLGASYLDEHGAELPVWMGSYGIGPARIVAAAVEQFADEHGISWPRALAPFAVHLVGIGKPGTPERDAAERLYETLCEGGVEVLYDDRDLGPGEKFADAELLGCPLRLTVGRRAVESGEIEVQVRRGREDAPGLPLDGEPAELVRIVDELWRSLLGPGEPPAPHASERVLAGMGPRAPARAPDGRSPARPRPLGPPPPETLAGDAAAPVDASPTRSASRGSR